MYRSIQKHPSSRNRLAIGFLMAFFVTASGCGGGGGSEPAVPPPTAFDGSLFTQEDTPQNGFLTGSGADNQTITYSIVSSGSQGTAVVTDPTSGAYTYTPGPNLNGTDTFTFKASDGNQDSNIATVTVTIQPVNDNPVAVDDPFSVDEDTAVTITFAELIVNDFHPDGASVSFSVVDIDSISANGGLITEEDVGVYTYTPPENYYGTDSFTYLLRDQRNLETTGNVIIDLAAVNDAPTTITSCELTQVNPGVFNGNLANYVVDVDTPAGSLIFGETVDVACVPSNKGTVTIDVTGAFQYSPFPNQRGGDCFAYSVNDGTSVITDVVNLYVDKTRVMALGDSITSGVETANGLDILPPVNVRVGFRKFLHDQILSTGYQTTTGAVPVVDFVGTQDHGNAIPNFDFNNEGHDGFQTIEIVSNPVTFEPLSTWLNQVTNGDVGIPAQGAPDIVMLHIGTNDISGSRTVNDILDGITDILDAIDDFEINNGISVTVVLAKIIGRADDNSNLGKEKTTTDLNNALDAFVQARAGDNILIVDQFSVIGNDSPRLLADPVRLHPDPTGYQQIAQKWLGTPNIPNDAPGLVDLLPKCQ